VHAFRVQLRLLHAQFAIFPPDDQSEQSAHQHQTSPDCINISREDDNTMMKSNLSNLTAFLESKISAGVYTN
jgi:hypothetical protein